MNNIPQLNHHDWLRQRQAYLARHPAPYYAMYSSVVGGIVTDPALMCVPVDDHVVHRGDGVFETLKCVDGALYNLDAHLARLAHSAQGIGLAHRFSQQEWTHLIESTVRTGGKRDALIRILLSRGPGSLGVNPYDCPQAELYIVVGPLAPSFMDRHPEGARIGFTAIPPKPPPFAEIKHCNYLPNALMAKEARDRGLDFVVGQGPDGRVLEGPTENLLVVTESGRLRTPTAPDVLPGTTLEQVIALSAPLVETGLLGGIERGVLERPDVEQAREVLMVGTSHDVIAVRTVEDRELPLGAEGPVYRALREALCNDIASKTGSRPGLF